MRGMILIGLGLAILASPAIAQSSHSASGASAEAVAIGGGGDGEGSSSTNYTYVSPPTVFGGTNPCEVGASGGVGVNGVGLSLGFSRSDRECSLRQWYVLMMESAKATGNPAYAQWARGIACSADGLLREVAPAGMCGGGIPERKAAAQVAVAHTATPQLPSLPDWCYTASPAERERFRQCREIKQLRGN